MKKIINGKKYDTETAKEIGSRSHGYPSDFYGFEEILYRKKTGEYFLYGNGGPRSKYGVYECGYESGGTEIIPLSPQEAMKWAEENIDADKYEAEFGEVDE